MAITFNSVLQQVANELGAVAGATAAVADANYLAAISDSTVIGPDFTKSAIQDAVAGALSDIVEAIASTPLHPERQRYAAVTASLANLADLPQAVGADRIIGLPRFVRDASDNKACLPTSLDKIRSFTSFSSTVFNGFSPYLYAINDGRIEHTRSNVVIGVCIYTRPTSFTGNINVEEHHESGLVWGAVAKLSVKESMFGDLYLAADKCWKDHLAQIRSYSNPLAYGKAQAAPSST